MRLAKIHNTDIKCWWECEATRTVTHCCWECKIAEPFWKAIWQKGGHLWKCAAVSIQFICKPKLVLKNKGYLFFTKEKVTKLLLKQAKKT